MDTHHKDMRSGSHEKRPCLPDSAGRPPQTEAPASHPARCRRRQEKSAPCRAPGGVGSSRTSPCSASRTHTPALAFVCPRGAAWWLVSARAIATLRRSCRSRCPRRRCRLLMAAPAACATLGMSSFAGSDRGPRIIHNEGSAKNHHTKRSNLHEPWVVVVVVVRTSV